MSSTLDEYYYSQRFGYVGLKAQIADLYLLSSANQLVYEANTLLKDIRKAL